MTDREAVHRVNVITYPVTAGEEFEHLLPETFRARGKTIHRTRTFRGLVTTTGVVDSFDLAPWPQIAACDADGNTLAILTEVLP